MAGVADLLGPQVGKFLICKLATRVLIAAAAARLNGASVDRWRYITPDLPLLSPLEAAREHVANSMGTTWEWFLPAGWTQLQAVLPRDLHPL
jgi:hypothetical protein